LAWLLPFSPARVRPHGFDRPSSLLIVLDALSLEVFRVPASAPDPRIRRSPTPASGCTSETGFRASGSIRPSTPPAALLCRRHSRSIRPGPHLASSPTPPEVSCPSGGIIAGVRSTRDYHPRHLPPMVFLRPPTVCSSKRLACSVSHRHHLWDSKNKRIARLPPRGPDRSIRRRSRPGSRSSDKSSPPGGRLTWVCRFLPQ
jgi:hypothetical protein